MLARGAPAEERPCARASSCISFPHVIISAKEELLLDCCRLGHTNAASPGIFVCPLAIDHRNTADTAKDERRRRRRRRGERGRVLRVKARDPVLGRGRRGRCVSPRCPPPPRTPAPMRSLPQATGPKVAWNGRLLFGGACVKGGGVGQSKFVTHVEERFVVLTMVALDPAVQRATCQGPRHCPHRLTAGICIILSVDTRSGECTVYPVHWSRRLLVRVDDRNVVSCSWWGFVVSSRV